MIKIIKKNKIPLYLYCFEKIAASKPYFVSQNCIFGIYLLKTERMITKTCGYAIRGVIFLALEKNVKRKIGIQEIAEELKVPQHFMGKILQELVRKEILKSTKGPHGGFYVNDSILDLSLIRIVEAIDGLGVLKKCFLGREECSHENPCPMHDDFEVSRRTIFENFQNKKIRYFVQQIEDGTTFLALSRKPF